MINLPQPADAAPPFCHAVVELVHRTLHAPSWTPWVRLVVLVVLLAAVGLL
ncbi:hypothetical protein WHI96_25055 [Pseudonocardia tropica]|uniref:Uncharacterized protein n=1 Tax=Pseudonocardia tropica TaxID=681289 RepID=A0ABV1K415_9PSEU